VIGDGTNQPAVVSATYQGVDYNQHPEFYWYNPSGGIYFLTNTPVNTPPGLGDGVGFILTPNGTVTCPNVQVYQDAMVAWVDHLMRLGADGVFIDEITDLQPCSGPGLSPPKHSHIPGSAIEAYKELLSKVRAKVKQYKPDGAVLGNTTNPIADLAYMPKEFWDYLDAGMMESHLLPGYPPPPYPGAPPDNITISWKFWHDQANDIEVQTRLKKGIQILALCDLNQYRVAQQYLQIFKLPGPPKSDETDTIDPTIVPTVKREYAFLSYATARLSGLVWGAAKLAAEPVCADLHRLRLGHAVTDELTWPSPAASPLIYYRIFEHGIVLVNPDPNNDIPFPLASIASARSPSGYFIDVFGDLSGSGVGDYKRLPQDIVAMPVSFKLNPNEQKTIPKFAGRVFLFGADTSYQP